MVQKLGGGFYSFGYRPVTQAGDLYPLVIQILHLADQQVDVGGGDIVDIAGVRQPREYEPHHLMGRMRRPEKK